MNKAYKLLDDYCEQLMESGVHSIDELSTEQAIKYRSLNVDYELADYNYSEGARHLGHCIRHMMELIKDKHCE